MSAYKDRVVETERVKERKRARVERGAVEPGNEERMVDRHAVASGKEETQHEENGMRDVHIGKRGSDTANEEQLDKLRKTVLFEQEAPNTLSSCVSEHPAIGEKQDRLDQVMLTTTYKFLRWVYFSGWVDDRVGTSKKCLIGIEMKMPEISGEVNRMSQLRA